MGEGDRLARLIESQREFYDLRAPDFGDDAVPDRRVGGAMPSEVSRALVDEFAPTEDVLELACGNGAFTRELLRYARTVTAVDRIASDAGAQPPGGGRPPGDLRARVARMAGCAPQSRRHLSLRVRDGHHRRVRVAITGVNLPGRAFCRPDGSSMDNVHVGIQVRRDPAQLVRADESETRWELEVEVVPKDEALDFRGPAVQGKRGDRFIYLTWGNVGPDEEFEMFRRAKLVLDRVEPEVIESAAEAGCLEAVVDLTGGDGGPRCARVDPPAIVWSVPEA